MISELYFRIIVYSIAYYLIKNKKSNIVRKNGWIILIAHLYKDITKLQEWPLITEYIGILMGYLLLIEGYRINDRIIILCGIAKGLAHIRKLIGISNIYYF